jgi:hypothetical protein
MVRQNAEESHEQFQELADWEHQLKALEDDIPREFEEPTP